jgi:hypothetical protein
MALISPGVEVTVIDESQYIPSATNSVPYILIATAQNKVSGTGTGIAAGTLAANANRVYTITSQRDLSATFGVPFFYNTSTGTPINGYELNEYGLLAAFSSLGISNRAYVQRADIDLAELTATLVRPTGNANNGDFWLDTANTLWGLFQWNVTTAGFANQVPLVITNTADLETLSTVPLQSIGSIGQYAVTATSIYNPVYFKRGGPTAAQTSSVYMQDLYNTWVLLGSDEWKTAWPTVTGTAAPTSLTAGNTFVINGTTITVAASPDNTVTAVADAINSAAITGVYAANVDGKLQIYCSSEASSDGSTADGGSVVLTNGTGTPLAALGITSGSVYYAPSFLAAPSFSVPRWRNTDTQPRPTGSIWQKTNNVNLGVLLALKRYDATLDTWIQQPVPVYASIFQALFAIDPSAGGLNIPVGAVYAALNPNFNNPATAGLELFENQIAGPASTTGSDTTPGPFVGGNQFSITASQPGTATPVTAVATLAGTTASDFVSAISAAAVPNVSATISVDGAIVITHATGGAIVLDNVTGTPLAAAGFTTSTRGVTPAADGALLLSSWFTATNFTYTASGTEPSQDPLNGRLWFYSAVNQADIMIQNNGSWQGYQNVTNDVRGYDLSLTNPSGPMFSTTAPLTQNDAALSPLVNGDLWIDTSDLENYPLIYRWETVEGVPQWVQLSNVDQTTENGVLFADARWATNGTTDPITDPLPTISSMLTSNYLDLDAPEPSLYPQGMLLFNTRRSGYNVKSFQVDYFNSASFPGDSLPTVTNAWVSVSGLKSDGSPYMGRQAQRALIVQALKAGMDTSTTIREEQREFNLIVCPQYPELIPNMIALNNERNNTAFVIGDTPLRLAPDGNTITAWATNNDGNGIATGDGLSNRDTYLGVFYPSCQTTDLSGSPVVQPPSHMMLRTIIRSDEVSFPWLAPAGTRRGVIDNAARIGYIDSATGEFTTLGVNQGLRDLLYDFDINPITFIPGVGITNFGNKTATSITSALDRINVARLVAFVRGRLQEIGKQFLFEPNDQITRNEISNSVNSLMIDLVNKRGIYDYLVVCDLSNNTPARIDRNELYVDIAIEPVKAVEFIYIPLRIKNTGEISAGTSSTAG